MAKNNSLGSVSRSLEKAIKKSTKQALTRAAASTRAEYAKVVSQDLGVKSGDVKKRSRTITSGFAAILSIGTKFRMAAHLFKPRVVKVMSKIGMRLGASYEIKGQGRIISEKGFLVKGKNSGKKIMIERQGKDRYPTRTTTVDVFKEAVLTAAPKLKKHMVDTFQKNFSSNLKFNLDK